VDDVAGELPTVEELVKYLAHDRADAARWGVAVDVRLQLVPGEGYNIWTGDPCYDTDHRGAWGDSTITEDCDLVEVATELLEGLRESLAQWEAIA